MGKLTAFKQAETKSVKFHLRDIATALVRMAGLNEGRWQLQFIFSNSATNLNLNGALLPSAINSVAAVQLARMSDEGAMDTLTVDAAQVNPGKCIIMPSGAIN